MIETFIQYFMEHSIVAMIQVVGCPGIALVLTYLFTDVLNLEMWRK